MSFIKINPNEKLNVAAVKLYHVSTHELEEETLASPSRGRSKETGGRRRGMSETVLKITTMEGETIYLHGPEADAALAILEATSS
jgi:hypothetical protein